MANTQKVLLKNNQFKPVSLVTSNEQLHIRIEPIKDQEICLRDVGMDVFKMQSTENRWQRIPINVNIIVRGSSPTDLY